MNRLSNADRCRVMACLVEGNSIRSTVRITGICKRTVSRLLVEFGEACERFADRAMTGLTCEHIQFIFCQAKFQSSPLPNLPPGCLPSDIPGNGRHDDEHNCAACGYELDMTSLDADGDYICPGCEHEGNAYEP